MALPSPAARKASYCYTKITLTHPSTRSDFLRSNARHTLVVCSTKLRRAVHRYIQKSEHVEGWVRVIFV